MMARYPTLEQFSEHPPMDRGRLCEHWCMGDADDSAIEYEGEWCTMFQKPLDDPTLNCAPECPEYAPWDCRFDDLLRVKSTTERKLQ